MQKNIWWQFVFFVIGHDFHSHTYENLLFFISSHPVAKGAWPQNYQMFASLPTLGPWRQWCSTKLWSLSKGRPLPRATGVHRGIFMWPSSENRTLGLLLIIVLGQRYTIKCSAERKYEYPEDRQNERQYLNQDASLITCWRACKCEACMSVWSESVGHFHFLHHINGSVYPAAISFPCTFSDSTTRCTTAVPEGRMSGSPTLPSTQHSLQPNLQGGGSIMLACEPHWLTPGSSHRLRSDSGGDPGVPVSSEVLPRFCCRFKWGHPSVKSWLYFKIVAYFKI